jgi:hypothetical protein
MVQRFSPSIVRRSPSRKSDLSPAQQRLLVLIRSIQFGRLEQLHVQGGLPSWSPPPRVYRTIKLGASHFVSPCSDTGELRSQWVELFDHLRLLGDGVVERIEVANGLPLTMVIEQQAPAA